MKKFYLLTITILLLCSCGAKNSDKIVEDSSNVIYLDEAGIFHLPKEVKVNENAASLFQFPGTRIFIQKPKRFDFVISKRRLQKGDDTFITAFEYPGSSFLEHKYNTIQKFKTEEFKNTIYYEQDVKVGKYDGYFVCGLGTKEGYIQLMMLFGDESFSALVLGEVEHSNMITINEIMASLLTVFVDKNKKPDYSVFQNYKIDLGKTGFQLNTFINGAFFYSKNPDLNLSDVDASDFFSITSLPDNLSEKEATDIFNVGAEQAKLSGFKIHNINYGDLKLRDYIGFQSKLLASKGEENLEVDNFVINDKHGAIMITSVIANNNSTLKKEVEKILNSIERLD